MIGYSDGCFGGFAPAAPCLQVDSLAAARRWWLTGSSERRWLSVSRAPAPPLRPPTAILPPLPRVFAPSGLHIGMVAPLQTLPAASFAAPPMQLRAVDAGGNHCDWTLVGHANQPPLANAAKENVPRFDIPEDCVEIVFVRHGTSLNNTFKEDLLDNTIQAARVSLFGITDVQEQWGHESATRFQRGYAEVCCKDELCGDYSAGASSSLVWEIGNRSRDGLLHPDGKNEARSVGRELEAALPADFPIHRFFTSPLRRTIETLFATFGSIISRCGGAHRRAQTTNPFVALQPWLHERYSSESDLALHGDTTASFVTKMAQAYKLSTDVLQKATAHLQDELTQLGDWVNKSGRRYPEDEDDRFAVDAEISEGYIWSGDDGSSMPFYPTGVTTWVEPESGFEERMTIIRRWLCTLTPGKRYVIVSHSRVGAGLFKEHATNGTGMLANNGIVVAQFRPDQADPEDASDFFADVALASEKWQCDVPGWAEDE